MKKRFKFNSIRTKILFGFSLVILLILIYGIYNYSVIMKSNEEAKNIVEKELPLLIANQEMARTMANRISTARGYVLFGGDFKYQYNDDTEKSKRNEKAVREIGASEEFDALIQKTVEWRTFVSSEVFDVYENGNQDLARLNLVKKDQDVRDIMAGYEKLADESRDLIIQTEAKIIENGKQTLFITTVLTILVVVVSLVAALITSYVISKPIIKIRDRMNLISNGDLSNEPLEIKSQDEVGQLVVATNEMNHNIRELLNDINIVSDQLLVKVKN